MAETVEDTLAEEEEEVVAEEMEETLVEDEGERVPLVHWLARGDKDLDNSLFNVRVARTEAERVDESTPLAVGERESLERGLREMDVVLLTLLHLEAREEADAHMEPLRDLALLRLIGTYVDEGETLAEHDAYGTTVVTVTAPPVAGEPEPVVPGGVPAPEEARRGDAHEEPPPPPAPPASPPAPP